MKQQRPWLEVVLYGLLWFVLGGVLGATSNAGTVRMALFMAALAVLFKSVVVFWWRPHRAAESNRG